MGISKPGFVNPVAQKNAKGTGLGTVLKPQGTGTVLKPTAPAQALGDGGGGGGTGGGGGGGGGGGYIAPYSQQSFGAAPMTQQDFLGSDAEYLAAEAAYKNVYDQLAASLTREDTNYNKDFGTALGNLGWLGADKGGWAMQNKETAAGRGYANLFDDFASRGMLRGSGFGEAEGSLRTSLQKQLDMLNDQKTQFSDAQNEKRTQASQTRDNNIKMAAAQALARMGAGLTG